MIEKDQIIDGKYRIVDLIGSGGMGAVYEGENVLIHRRVAIKVLHANASKNAQAVERFQREAQAAGRIGNDHILEVLDLGELESGEKYMVMEYLDGETLGARIARAGGLTAEAAVPLVRQALLGLRAAHAAGIVHRDLKPENIFICRQKAGQSDFVKLIDFGVSKFSPTSSDMAMTRTGAVMGTPYYMSPEQARGGKDIDNRSDLYTMGVILYESVTGSVPFAAETFNELMFKIALSEPAPLRQKRPDIDEGFEAMTLKAMARDAADRFQSADEFMAALDGWLGARGLLPRPPSPTGARLDEATTRPTGSDAPRAQTAPSAWANTQAGMSAGRARGIVIAAAVVLGLAGVAIGGVLVWKARAAQNAGTPVAASAAMMAEGEPIASAAPDETAPSASASGSAELPAEPAPSATALAGPAPPERPTPQVAPSQRTSPTKTPPVAVPAKPKPSAQPSREWGY